MNQALKKLLTTYNNKGQINKQQVFETKRKIYQQQIQYSIHADSITNNVFTFKPLHIDFMESLVLKDQPKFKEIKTILTQYNSDILVYGDKPRNGLHFKTVIMDSMLKFMRMMMLAPDSTSKKKILQVSHSWFMKKLKPEERKKHTHQKLNQQIRNIMVQQKLLPIKIIDKQLPSQKVQRQLEYYKQKARTQYKQLDAPYVDLENYRIRKVQFSHEIHQPFKSQVSKQESNKWLDRLKFIKPNLDMYKIVPEEKQQAKSDKQQPQKEIAQPTNDAEIVGQQPIPQQLKKGQIVIDTGNNDFGMDLGDDDNQQIPQPQEDQDKKRGKLDPLVKIFILKRQQQKKNQQIKNQKRFMIKQNNNNQNYWEDNQQVYHIQRWAGERSRLKTQIARKTQSKRRFLRNISQRSQKSNPVGIMPFQNSMNSLRINDAIISSKRSGAQYKLQKLNTQPSLSLYDGKRSKPQDNTKRFSSMLTQESRRNTKDSYLDQIQDIKSKFSKYKIYAPANKLMKGLMHPQEKDQTQKNQTLILPLPQLPSNPFFKVAKKKKKKKKK